VDPRFESDPAKTSGSEYGLIRKSRFESRISFGCG